jgi:hypothetical protein
MKVLERTFIPNGKAKVVRKTPFTIKLLYESKEYIQPVVAGVDSGSTVVGCAAIANGKVVYQSEIQLRQDVSKKMDQRRMYRRNRRGRKTRYRPPRFNNRAASRREGRLAPSIRSKLESHIREKNFVESILPVTKWKVETASFDIHKITNPEVSGIEYQEGPQKGFYNVKAFVLDRDGYKCQHCKGKTKDKHLQCHHIVFRSDEGPDTPETLITLCKTCHRALHAGDIELKKRSSKTKHATEVGIIKSQLNKSDWEFEENFGYQTKFKRELFLKLPKTHYNDAIAICCEDGQTVKLDNTVFHKKHVPEGDYQQTRGKRSEKKIPTGKVFGLRKYDLVKTEKGIGFIRGKRSSGYFTLCDIFGNMITTSVNIKKNCIRLRASSTTLIQAVDI